MEKCKTWCSIEQVCKDSLLWVFISIHVGRNFRQEILALRVGHWAFNPLYMVSLNLSYSATCYKRNYNVCSVDSKNCIYFILIFREVRIVGRECGGGGMSSLVGAMLDALPLMWRAKVPANQVNWLKLLLFLNIHWLLRK